MKPFPQEKDLAFLRGLTLSCVTLGPYQIDLTFDDNTIITAEHFLQYVDETGVVRRYDIQNELEPIAFHVLVRDKAMIENIAVDGLLLTLTFSKGRKLIIEFCEGPLESGHIIHRSGYFVF